MKRFKVLAMAVLLVCSTAMSFGQRITSVPIYDGLNKYTSGNYIPLVWNIATHAMEKKDTALDESRSITVSGTTGKGFYGKNKAKATNVAFIGVGRNGAGAVDLSDSGGTKYFTIKDTLGVWQINSQRKVSIKTRGVQGIAIDTLGAVSIDSALTLTTVAVGTAGTDSALVLTSAGLVKKVKPTSMTTLTANGNGIATTFTLSVATGKTICTATSQNSAATVQGCAISGTTLTVTTTAAPIAGSSNVKFTVIYQ